MPILTANDNTLTVINLFSTDSRDKQARLISEMRKIVDTAAYPGWISSTVHSGQDKPGTANFIQWRSREDLEARYAGEVFKHRTVPLFSELSTMRLLQTVVVFTQRQASQGAATEISPQRDDYTVIEFFAVPDADQEELMAALGPGRNWLLETPGYRTHSVLRGLGARGHEGAFIVVYSQWDSTAAYDTFRTLPEDQQAASRRQSQSRVQLLATASDWNSYRVVHTRSAQQPAA